MSWQRASSGVKAVLNRDSYSLTPAASKAHSQPRLPQIQFKTRSIRPAVRHITAARGPAIHQSVSHRRRPVPSFPVPPHRQTTVANAHANMYVNWLALAMNFVGAGKLQLWRWRAHLHCAHTHIHTRTDGGLPCEGSRS